MIKKIKKIVEITTEQDNYLKSNAISFSLFVKNKINQEMIKNGNTIGTERK